MTFTFVHTADWQLGKPFASFAGDIASRLTAARLDAIGRIGETAVARQARHVLVAGDVFDSERAQDGLIQTALSRMAAYPTISWHMLPGNHDPARSGGVWARVGRLGTPPNVHLRLTPEAVAIASGVELLSAPLTAKEMRSDPTAWMEAHANAVGIVRIGMAHGSVQGFGSLGEAAVPIDTRRRAAAALDYLALGDWHGTKEVASGVWYSGTPEPDSYSDNGPGNVLVVEIDAAGAPPKVEVVETAAFLWLERRVVMSRLADLGPVESEIRRLGAAAPRHLLSLQLEGALGGSEMQSLEALLGRLSAALMTLDVDRRRLRTAATKADIAALGQAGEGLAEVAGRLAVMAAQPGSDARIAERALRHLMAMTVRSSNEREAA